MRKILYTLIFVLTTQITNAQKFAEFKLYEDSILLYINKILNYQTDSVTRYYSNQKIKFVNKRVLTADSAKLAYSEKISDLFGYILSKERSYKYNFDKLKNISKLKSSDSLLRIITWDIPLQDGTFKYFGYLQKIDKKSGKVFIFKLIDKSEKIRKPEFAKLKPQKWYGALYYKIITNTYDKKTYYTLLAWDGNNQFTNKKLIECLSFKNNKATFGEPIFLMKEKAKNRIIFEFAKSVRMMLRYDKNLKMIVYDHLSPSNRKFTNQYMYYGPDMSHDGIKFSHGNWQLRENLNLKNKQKTNVKKMPKSY